MSTHIHFQGFEDGSVDVTMTNPAGITTLRPITRGNPFDFKVEADRRDLARTLLTEVLGWRQANQLERPFALHVIANLAPLWHLEGQEIEDWAWNYQSRAIEKAMGRP